MGLPKLKTKISVEDYLEGEKVSQIRHEYIDGEVYAMAGTSDNHNRVAGNLYSAFLNHLRTSDCEPFVGDIKVRLTSEVYYYPDVLISCEKNPEDSHFRNKPILIVEVISPSTEHIDRREKLLFYQQIPSLQEYVVIEQKEIAIEIHRRQPNGGWITYYFDESDDEVEFQSIDMTLAIDEIYRRVKFEG